MSELQPIRVHVLVRRAYPFDPVEDRKRIFNELMEVESWKTQQDEFSPFIVEVVEPQKDVSKNSFRHSEVTIQFRYVDPPTFPVDEGHWIFKCPSDEEDPKTLFADHAAEELVFAARQLLLCANLAAPGSISAISFEARFQGMTRLDSEWMLGDVLWFAAEESHRKGWPNVRSDLPLSSVWDWAQAIPGFSEGVGSTPIGRALAAVSHLFSSSIYGTTGDCLLWALLGLEAIYGRGRSGLLEQLRAKSAVLLGSPTEHKKMVSAMYDYRSRFIHGDLDVPFKNAPFDELPGFTGNLNESEATAVAVLISTLQELISSGRTNLEFEYRLVD